MDAHGGTLTLDDSGTKNTSTQFLQETHTITFTVTDQAVTRVATRTAAACALVHTSSDSAAMPHSASRFT